MGRVTGAPPIAVTIALFSVLALILRPLMIINGRDDFHRLEHARPVAMNIHDLRVVEFFRLELLVELVARLCRLVAAGVPDGLRKDFGQKEPARRIGRQSLTDVSDSFHHAVVGLRGRGKRVAREMSDLYPAVRPLFYLFAPLLGENAVSVRRSEDSPRYLSLITFSSA